MKKLISVLIIAASFAVSAFALNFTVGGNFNIGGTVSDDAKFHGYSAGSGAFFNLDLLLGFGVQAEVNVSEDYLAIDGNTITIDERYSIIDMPVMAWWNVKLGPIGFGAGVGPNFSGTVSDYKNDNVTLGLAAGANSIFYIGNHFGIVLGVHGVFDFTSRFVVDTKNPEEGVTKITINTQDWKRRSVYGTVGVEYRF